MNEVSVRGKLLSLALVPTFIMSLLLALYGYRDLQLLHEGVVAQGTAEVRHLADLAEFGLATANGAQLMDVAHSAAARGAILVRIYNAKGELRVAVGETGRLAASPAPAGTGACGESRGLFLFCAPVLLKPLAVEQFGEFAGGSEEVPLGRVEMALDATDLEARRAAVIRDYSLVLLLVIAIGFFLARAVERQLARPIARLREGVERVGAGDLSMQVEENAGGELLVLQHGFNAMARSLASNHAEQERRIEEATARLRRTLEELEQRNVELGREKQRAEEASHAKSRFLAVMSHEIRTPLSGMLGMLALLRKEGVDREASSHLRYVTEAAETLRVLIDDILDYSRIEAGKLPVFQDPISLDDVIEDVVSMFAPSAADRGLDLIVHVEPDVPDAVMGDALRLRQVLINLTANAIKFTDAGSVSIEVRRAGGSAERPRLLFVVEDTGIGIPPDRLGQVFEGFTQVDSGPTRRYGGSGLGATISQELVRLMGGEVQVASRPGEGSRFWFELTLPIDPAGSARCPGNCLAGRKVTVIDPDARSRAATAAALAGLRGEVTALATPEEFGGGEMDYVVLSDPDGRFTDETVARLRARARCVWVAAPVNASVPPAASGVAVRKPVTRASLVRLVRDMEQREAGGDADRPGARSLRLLVAEDDEINARVLEVFLRRMGHGVTRVRDGREALELLERESFDLAILDVRMPDVDGPTVAARWRCREREKGGHLPMAALTANGSEEDMEVCIAAGMDEFLIKPVSEQTLEQLLARWTAPDRQATGGG